MIFFNLNNDDSTDCVWTRNEKNIKELIHNENNFEENNGIFSSNLLVS